MNLLVLGAGAWGTALAAQAAGRHQVTLWARDPAQASQLRAERENRRYLPGVALPDTLHFGCGPEPALQDLARGHDLTVIATPVAGLRDMLQSLRRHSGPIAWLCKGLESPREGVAGLLGHEIQAQVAPGVRCGVLSGPSFALEVARGQPTALVAASSDPAVRDALVQAFHGAMLRVYASDDVVGVEVGGAVKNVLAIAAGLCDGLGLGLNARAALVTRGLAEMTRLGLALGAREQTFMGLAGLGDLILTATGDLSRNRQVGLLLAKGLGLAEALASLGHVAEGVHCARTVAQRADHLGVDMPITRAVVFLLEGRMRPGEALAALMSREATSEVGRAL